MKKENTTKQISSHGGAKRGQGAPNKYGEETARYEIQLPKSKKVEIVNKFKEILKEYEVKKIKNGK